MKALVTGSSGFIGSHMVKLLEGRGHEATGFDLKEGHDIREPIYMGGFDWVFHFAGLADLVPSIADPSGYIRTNVQGTANVIDACRKAGVKKFVYAASSSCYGAAPPAPTNESDAIDCRHPYALSKWLGEQTALTMGRIYGLPVNSIRIFNAFGRGQRSTGYGAMFSVFMRQKLEGVPLTIVGPGNQKRDFVHVSDVCEAFLLAAETDKAGEIWNVGSGDPASINYIAKLIGGPTTNIPKRPGEPDCTWASVKKIKRDLGWAPTVTIERGVFEMLEHIHEWDQAPLWSPDSIAEQTKDWFKVLA